MIVHRSRGIPFAVCAALLAAAGCSPPPAKDLPPPVPSGAIVAFAGSEVPAGWTICDGRATPAGRKTPDLRDRFVMGGVPGEAAGEEGGSARHAHRASVGKSDGGLVGVDTDNDAWAAPAGHGHGVSVAEAEALPPFVRLIYLMKD